MGLIYAATYICIKEGETIAILLIHYRQGVPCLPLPHKSSARIWEIFSHFYLCSTIHDICIQTNIESAGTNSVLLCEPFRGSTCPGVGRKIQR